MKQKNENMIDSPPVTALSSVLIAGCGYVGLRAARMWQSRGIRTFAITRNAAKAGQLQAEGIRPVILDLASQGEWPALPDTDVVLWSVGFDRSTGASRHAVWIDGLRRLLAALPRRIQPRRIIYTSSTGVYGDGDGQDVDESTAVGPTTEGGAACAAAEQMLNDFSRDTGTDVCILRLAGIYGPDRLLRRVSELRGQVPLATQPDEWLNLIHVDDAVRMIDFAAVSGIQSGISSGATGSVSIMNVVAANSVTRRTYYSTLAQLVSAPEPIFNPPSSANSASPSHQGRRGNRRVISVIRPKIPVQYQFDDCRAGLANAIAGTVGLTQDQKPLI